MSNALSQHSQGMTPPLLPDPTRSNLSGEGTSTMHNHGSGGEVIGVAHEGGNIEMEGMHPSGHTSPHLILTMPNESTENTSEPSRAEDTSRVMGGTHSSDGASREANLCSYHLEREDKWERLATMPDPLLGVIVQGAFSLVAYKSSDGASVAVNVLFYLVLFLVVLGVFFSLAGKYYGCAKMGVIALVAAALAFLMTTAFVVIYKI